MIRFTALTRMYSCGWHAIKWEQLRRIHLLKPNSWTYNFIEVSWHNLESSQTWGFCMDFLNQREGVWFSIRFSFSLLCKKCKSLREFEEIEISSQICTEVTVNNKEENSWDFCQDFDQEFGLWSNSKGCSECSGLHGRLFQRSWATLCSPPKKYTKNISKLYNPNQ